MADIFKMQQAGQLPIKSAVIDIVDNLHQACMDYVCKAKGIEHPQDANDYGKTWGEVTKEWTKVLRALMGCINVRFISHASMEQVEILNENNLKEEVSRARPTFSGSKAAQYLDGVVSAMGYMMQNGSNRYVITFKQDAKIGAKDRTDILHALGPIVLPDDPNASFAHVAKLYDAQAKKMGFNVQPKKG